MLCIVMYYDCAIATVLSIIVSLEGGSGVQLNTSNAVFESGDGVEITWLPETIVPIVDPDSYTVDVRLSCFDNESDTFEELAVVASGIPNSGQAIITLPAINISGVCPLSIQVSLSGSTASLINAGASYFGAVRPLYRRE